MKLEYIPVKARHLKYKHTDKIRIHTYVAIKRIVNREVWRGIRSPIWDKTWGLFAHEARL